jgi:hypothetical protein
MSEDRTFPVSRFFRAACELGARRRARGMAREAAAWFLVRKRAILILEALTFLVLPTMRMLAPYRATRPDYNVMFSLI